MTFENLISSIPHYDVDFYSDAVIQEPHPHYREMRRLGPVVWLPRNNVFALPRYEEVSCALRMPEVFSSAKGVSLNDQANALLVGSTLNSDPPIHDLTRSVTAAPLLPGALGVVRESIEHASRRLVEELATRRTFDAIPQLAQVLPVTIVSELVGLPDAGREKMLEWAAATFDLFGSPNQRSIQALEKLKELRAFLDVYGKPEHLKPNGWAARIFTVGTERGLPFETCVQLMRDYINPSLDTTISAIGYGIWLFAKHPEQWEMLRADRSLIPNAVEEIVRLASPIRAFSRYVTRDYEIGGTVLQRGTRILVLFASANRDSLKWTAPDRFDIHRKVKDHVGFGSGIHMCMGMHLAKLEMTSLLNALAERVRAFDQTGQHRFVMNNTIHALATLPIALQLDDTVRAPEVAAKPSAPRWKTALIKTRRQEAIDIVSLELAAADGTALPRFTAGAHIDIRLRNGLVRQYSLSNDPDEAGCYRLGVLKATDSRGGSEAVHAYLAEEQTLDISLPRNNFPVAEHATKSILLAGGIGITPLLAMGHRLNTLGKDFTLHYCVRSQTRAAFLAELEQFGHQVRYYFGDGPASRRIDFTAVLGAPERGKHMYACGPRGFMTAAVSAAIELGWQQNQIHVEHFGSEIDTNGETFTVEARRSDITVSVPPGTTIATALRQAGVPFDMSCQSGVCGTCLTAVIEGLPDHRDLVQTEEEKASSARIAICCSRSKTQKLVLDI